MPLASRRVAATRWPSSPHLGLTALTVTAPLPGCWSFSAAGTTIAWPLTSQDTPNAITVSASKMNRNGMPSCAEAGTMFAGPASAIVPNMANPQTR